MPVNITDEELDMFNKNGFSDDDVRETVNNYRSQGLDDNAIRGKIDQRLNSWRTPVQQPMRQPVQQPIDKQAEVDRIRAEFAEKNKQIDRENRKALGRIGAGALIQSASGLPIFNIPRVGTGVGGALFELGQGLMEGDKANDLLKRTGTGFAVGEALGVTPYVGRILGKTKVGQTVGNAVGKLAETELAKKTGQILSTNVDNNAAGQAIAKVGNVLGVGKTIPQKVETAVEGKIVTPEVAQVVEPQATKAVSEVIGETKQSGLPQSVINAKGTPTEVKQILKNDFPEYQVMHNNELTKQAVQEVESNFNNELSRLTSAKEFEALDYEKSRQIAKRLFDAGRHEEAINLIDNVSENATKKGQAIQALSLWSNMTPEGAVYKAEKLIKEYNKKVPERKHIKLSPEQIEKIRELQNAALNSTDDLERTQGLARTAKYVSELVPKNIGQKLKAYRNISLLLNPKTLGRNIIGNTLFNAVDTVSKAAAVPIDRAIGLVTGNKTRVAPQINELVKGGLKGAKVGFQEALEGIDTRGLGKRFDLQEGRTFKNPVMQKLETALDVGLRVPDRTQYEATFAESVANMMKAQGLKEPTQEILEQAEREALESVFQNDSRIANFTTKSRKALNDWIGTKDFGLGDLAIPYAQTPANLVQQAINYSPLGAVKGIGNLVQGNQRQASLDLARALMGTGLIGGSYGLSKAGNITPSQFNEDYQKNRLIKANLATMGIKPETINGMWYAPFQPMSTSVAIGNAMANGENPLQAGLNTMLDLPFLQNFNKAISDIRDKGYVQAGLNFASSIPAQFAPTVGNQVGQTIDPYQREAYDPNVLKRGINQAIAKVPGLSKTLPEKIDVQGKPIERYTSEGVQRMFDIFVNPTYINEPTNDAVMNELKALYDETGDTKQFLPIVDKKLRFKDANGEEQKIELTGEQLSNYQKVLGSRLYQAFEKVMQTNRYQGADYDTRIKILNEQKQAVKNEVDEYLFNKPNVQSRKKVKDPTAKLKRLQNKIDKQLIQGVMNELSPIGESIKSE